MSLPRFSIITPSFNQGEYLEDTIRSVLQQRYPNLEYLVVDGGSTDDSPAIIKRYESSLAWTVSEKDGGQSDAVNKGLRRATGDIIGWLNSDDRLLPGALNKVAAYFAAHPEKDALIGDLEIIDQSGRLLDIKKAVPVTMRRNLYSGCAVPQPATFFTRRAMQVTGEIDGSLHYQMDYEYFLRMQAKGVNFGLIAEPLAQFRLHGASKTVSEYRRLFWRDFARIQSPYLRVPFRGATLELYRRLMKWVTRCEIFLLRALTRGVVVPFRYTRVRHNAQDR